MLGKGLDMLRKKTWIGAAALAVGPVALMAPANAYYTVGTCDSSSAGVTLTVVSSAQPAHWEASGHINDGQGRTWIYKIFSKISTETGNGSLKASGTRTGTGDVPPAGPAFWVKRGTTERVKLVVENAAGTIRCTAFIDVG